MRSLQFVLGLSTFIFGLIWLLAARLQRRPYADAALTTGIGLLLFLWAWVLPLLPTTAVAWTLTLLLWFAVLFVVGHRSSKRETDRRDASEAAFDYVAAEAEISRLKRDQRDDEALSLLRTYVTATEVDARRHRGAVRSWPYQQLTVLYRKRGDIRAEYSILQRFAGQRNSGSKQSQRLLDRLEAVEPRAVEQGAAGRAGVVSAAVARGVVVNCKTTGYGPADEVIELALISFEYHRTTGQILRTVSQYAGRRAPTCPIHPDVQAQLGIGADDLQGQKLDDARGHAMLEEADVLVAHNVSYVRRFLVELFPPAEEATWRCSMNGIPWLKYGHASKALASLLADFGLESRTTYPALDEATATLLLIAQTNPATGQPYSGELLAGESA